MTYFLKGLSFGFLLAAAVGPMWILCFRRTLAQGQLAGFVSGLGIAVADAIYGAIAAFGLTAVSGFLLRHQFWIGLAGGAFLVYLGIGCLRAKPAMAHESRDAPLALPQAFVSTLGLTLANPPTILAFIAIFAGLGIASADAWGAMQVVAGVLLGSAFWWLVLALVAGRLRGRIGPRVFRAINLVSGVAILGFAAWQFATLLR